MMSVSSSNMAERIARVAPELTALVKAHNDDTFPEGPEALTVKIETIVNDASLMESRVCQVDKIGIFPGNREKAMAIPVDVQTLLHNFMLKNGFNPSRWDCMCLTIPESVRSEWTEKNKNLVRRSAGYLADYGDIDLVSGRGSHGTAALRAAKFGAKSMFPKIADSNGNISRGACIDKQPSIQKPLDEGVLVKIIPGELELAVPGIFQVLSRVGNVSNSSYRPQTTLQSCARIHELAVQQGDDVDFDKVNKQASIGMPPEDEENVHKISAFVQKWSGGAEGQVLKNLSEYEMTLQVRRKVKPDDLEKLAIDMPESRIVPVPWFSLLYLVVFSLCERCMHACTCSRFSNF